MMPDSLQNMTLSVRKVWKWDYKWLQQHMMYKYLPMELSRKMSSKLQEIALWGQFHLPQYSP